MAESLKAPRSAPVKPVSIMIGGCRPIDDNSPACDTALASTSRPPAPPSSGSPRWPQAIGQETERRILSSRCFPRAGSAPTRKMFADLRSGALEFFMAGATLGEVAPTSALPLLPFAFRGFEGGVRGARRRARRPDPQRVGAARHPCLPPLPAERVSSSDDQHAADPHRRRSRRSKDPQPGRRDRARFLRGVRGGGRLCAVQPDVRRAKGAQLRRAERPARRRVVAAALRGAEPSEPDRPLVVGLHACWPMAQPGALCRAKCRKSSSAMPRNSRCCSATTSSR